MNGERIVPSILVSAALVLGVAGCPPVPLDDAACGAVGRTCSKENVAWLSCRDGVCTSTCLTGWLNVNQPASGPDDGCETVDLGTNVENCGATGRSCSSANVAVSSCQGGVCTSTCQTGWLNVSRPASGPDDGCETIDTSANIDHCGEVGRGCSSANVVTRTCASGLCTSICQSGYANVSRPAAPAADDGCDVPLAGGRVLVGSGTDAACIPWSEANGDWIPGPVLPDQTASDALASARSALAGTWIGTARAPGGWSPESWMLEVTFKSDGRYTAVADGDYPPFYYDYDPAFHCDGFRHWDVTGVSVAGIDGVIELPYDYGSTCDSSGLTQPLNRIELDTTKNRLRFEFGPVVYDLRRACTGADAGTDASIDSGADAGTDASIDSGADAGTDANGSRDATVPPPRDSSLEGDRVLVGSGADAACLPWNEAQDDWIPGPDPMNQTVSEALASARAAVSSTWIGTAWAPASTPGSWMVRLTFTSDGHYTAIEDEGYQVFNGAIPRCDALRRWDLRGVSAVGFYGLIDVPFGDDSSCWLPVWQGLLDRIELDTTKNRLRFEFMTDEGNGPVIYDLRRACPTE